MKKFIASTIYFLLLTVVSNAQVHRDTDGSTSTGLDYLSVGIGVVIGLIIGYLVGSRAKKT